ncbi:unnamed protein product [Didymodactylos carnosus]|uniref:BZIP domain-containing protein n=1 Tax=Didymodactylos carnosus TaxID=1234261 RepID=A0A813QYS4_9BILA|nr:unnamed protein product [Didymodactylos carnosus]CAF0983557.1 unnamed protein product [Didymodactylos carnosus]CAF3556314.1 unnamed protein product [Didymodactylos carnosus]CAF3753996.1 unnamed protein product [Didymodactylos carnosus]
MMLNCENKQEQSILEPNLSFVASNETVHTTSSPPRVSTSNPTFVPNNSSVVVTNQTTSHNNMSPPIARPGFNITTADRKLRPNSLDIHRQTVPGHSMLTPGDYSKLVLSTPELDEKLRGYTNIVTNTSTPTVQLQTPDLINSITNALSQQQQQSFISDGTPSPSIKSLEDLISSHQSQPNITHSNNTNHNPLQVIQQLSSQQPSVSLSSDNNSSALAQQFLMQINSPQLQAALANALRKSVSTSNNSTTTLNTEINNRVFTTDNNTNNSGSMNNISRNRSHSSSMDASVNGSSTSSSPSPITQSSSSIMNTSSIPLGKIKDEPQHVPSSSSLITTTATSNMVPGVERINMEHNEVIKREKKRERNRQAAQKCRTRKLTRIAELQKRVNELQDNNKQLNDTAEKLRQEISKLERQLSDHQTSGCNLTLSSVPPPSITTTTYSYSR